MKEEVFGTTECNIFCIQEKKETGNEKQAGAKRIVHKQYSIWVIYMNGYNKRKPDLEGRRNTKKRCRYLAHYAEQTADCTC